ncbi:phosphoribosylglycinamide formyltransferase KNAG_0C04480 [Huiozyma naganishii CBS 8797]|uniref:Phosphoribosylglycinamide formyltransferase n=1 Tax=Huiozyma naganishii (strain ATCC MYA-139 / BCRC 22969 / CBS 8797 / KCTC 17520 / NBRC 10181 / NCYC 3082 / Yp74L-3) TaxID=1071383 RepID=J7R3Z3_HUIN7|nr:hypothetical protein KNAG_0C04480 [Kazachstania naganishii CBS 8797]CCK69550.1 hypothetical protein KNAG_0C04480 [Kazachstania naganishii CBS 8797]
MSRVVVLISGSGSNLQALIDAQKDGKLASGKIVSVISSSKNAYGLMRAANANIPTRVHSLYSYNKDIAKEDTVERQRARSRFDEDLAKLILADKPDLIVCAGWLLILSENFLNNIGQVPIINLHPALPGQFDGTTHAIELAWQKCQDSKTPLTAGCMVHYLIKEVDKGEPLLVKELGITPGGETLQEYEERVHKTEHIAIVEATVIALKNVAKH